jgi:hypothetical protein
MIAASFGKFRMPSLRGHFAELGVVVAPHLQALCVGESKDLEIDGA